MSLKDYLYIAAGIFAITVLYEAIQHYLRRRSEPVLSIEEDDPNMIAAISRAQASLPMFWEAFEAKRAMDSRFSIKARLEHNGEAEHIWCELLERKAGSCRARVLNIPACLPFNEGDIISVGDSQITDWIFLRDDHAMGGETQKVLDEMTSGNLQPQA